MRNNFINWGGALNRSRYIFYKVLSRRVEDACLFASPYRDAKKHRSRYIFLQEAGKKTLERTNQMGGCRGPTKNTVLDQFYSTVLSRRVEDACLFASPYRDAKKHPTQQKIIIGTTRLTLY